MVLRGLDRMTKRSLVNGVFRNPVTGIFLFALFIAACSKREQPHEFDRLIIATTYANNNLSSADSLELTNTVCTSLIFMDEILNCLLMNSSRKGDRYYAARLDKTDADSLSRFVFDLRKRFPQRYNFSNRCAPDINIVVENDTTTDYHFIQNYRSGDIEYIFKFVEAHATVPVDTPEVILKYRYYIVARVAYLTKDRFGLNPVNYLYTK